MWKKIYIIYKSILVVMLEYCILLNYGLICLEEGKDYSCDEINWFIKVYFLKYIIVLWLIVGIDINKFLEIILLELIYFKW